MAALFWLLFVWRWFDVGTSFRPAWLEVVPPFLLAVPALLLSARFVALRRAILIEPRPELRLLVGLATTLAVLFRLPFVAQGAAGAVTPDGALSGIVMLRVLRGAEHLVFVPHVPYSGSLKSHLAAVFAVFMDPACAFALVSVLFYALFVAGVCRLAVRPRHTKAVVLAAGLYAAFAPPFVTRYSLSNDGNYVEVLGLGTWALVLAVRWAEGPGSARRTVAFVAGILLGLAFWCHILAVIPLAAISVFFLVFDWRAALRSFPALAAGWALGDAPGLLWNLAHRGESFYYLLPGGPKVGGEAAGPGFAAHLAFLVTDHLPVLFGSDTGYGVAMDRGLYLFGCFGLVLVAVAAWRAAGPAAWRGRDPALLALLVFAAVNVVVALLALPYLPGNARYVLFLTTPAAVLLARSFAPSAAGRGALFVLVAGGALGSLAHLPGTARADTRWRRFVSDLEAANVRHCYSDFYLATKINFLSGERVVCSAKLGPTTTEYFFDYRSTVEGARDAALVAVNTTAAHRLEERLFALGVAFRRLDLMKPVLLPTRKVDPEELFPNRDFPLR